MAPVARVRPRRVLGLRAAIYRANVRLYMTALHHSSKVN